MFGNLSNRMMERSKQVEPKVGIGCTECMFSDRHAYTIIDVSLNGKKIVVQEDIATRIDKNGMSESQTYDYTPNPNGKTVIVTLRKNGRWILRAIL